MAEEKSEKSLDERLKRLESKLDSSNRLRQKKEPDGQGKSSSAGFGRAMRLSSEFIVAIMVGAGIGWGIDQVFGSGPWAMIVFLLLGFCAGVLNVMRSAGLVAENRALSRGRQSGNEHGNQDDSNEA